MDLIGLKKNYLIFRKNNYLQKNLENKLYIIVQLKNNYLFPRVAWVYD